MNQGESHAFFVMTYTELPGPDSVNERVFKAVSALLVGLMMTCAVMTLVALTSQSFGGWRPLYLPALAFLISIERFYLHRTDKPPQQLDRRRLLSWGAFWVAILILLKLVVMSAHGWQALIAEIPLWQEDFVGSFFTREYLSVLVICLLVWVTAGVFADLFSEMSLERIRITRDYGLNSSDQERLPGERLQSFVFTLGAFLVVLTALARMDLRAILSMQPGNHFQALPWLAGGGFSTLLYFMLGFALLSLTKFINLNTRWALQGIPVSQKIAGRWAVYSLVFLIFLAVMVSLLPTHYSMGLISILHEPLSMILAFVALVASALWALIFFPILALLSLFASTPIENLPTAPPAVTAITDPPISLSLPGWEIIRPYLFWGLFLFVVVYALRYYLLQHEELLHALQKSPILLWLQQLRHWIANLFRSVNQQITTLLDEGVERLRSVGTMPRISRQGRFISLGRLSPRQQIRFYYYALIRRGHESNLSRKESESPTEYARKLGQNLPSMDTEIDIMTDNFIKARYSQQVIDKGDVKFVKQQWERVRQVLRRRRISE